MTEPVPPHASPPAPAGMQSAPRRILRKLWRTTVGFLAIIGLMTVVRPFLFDLTLMSSGSMAPTLQGDAISGDWILAEKISYWFRRPQRWEIVEFNDHEGIQVMKRVAALPGESISIQNDHLQINGHRLDPPDGTAHVKYYPFGNLAGGKSHDVIDGYYVLGDDSIDSEDSRYEGSVAPSRIRARGWLIVWPPGRMGWVR